MFKSYSLAVVLFSLIGCNERPKEPVYVEYFKQGQILLPDYVNSDTTVVINAIGLNKAIAPIEQGLIKDFGSDEDYADLFSEFTIPLADYQADKEYYSNLKN